MWRLPSPCSIHLGCSCYAVISTACVCKLLPVPSCWWALLSCCRCGPRAGLWAAPPTVSSGSWERSCVFIPSVVKTWDVHGMEFNWGIFWLEPLSWVHQGKQTFPCFPWSNLEVCFMFGAPNLPDSLSPQLLLHPLGNECAQHLQGQPFGRPSLGTDPSPGTDRSPCWNQYKDFSDPGRSEVNALGCTGGSLPESLAGAGGRKAWYSEKSPRF